MSTEQSRITQQVIGTLFAAGLEPKSSLKAIKEAARDVVGVLSKNEVNEIRTGLTAFGETASETTTQEETPVPQAKKGSKMGKPREAKKAKPSAVKVEEEVSQEDLLDAAKLAVKKAKKDGDKRFANVIEVTEATSKGNPARVVIECTDGSSPKCEKTREIAVQDLFQVSRCTACQRRVVSQYRGELAKRRRAKLREMEGRALPNRKTSKAGKAPKTEGGHKASVASRKSTKNRPATQPVGRIQKSGKGKRTAATA